MSTAKAIAGVVPGLMAVSLVGRTISYLPKDKELKGKVKPKPMKPIQMFTEIAVGVPFVGATAGMVNKLP